MCPSRSPLRWRRSGCSRRRTGHRPGSHPVASRHRRTLEDQRFGLEPGGGALWRDRDTARSGPTEGSATLAMVDYIAKAQGAEQGCASGPCSRANSSCTPRSTSTPKRRWPFGCPTSASCCPRAPRSSRAEISASSTPSSPASGQRAQALRARSGGMGRDRLELWELPDGGELPVAAWAWGTSRDAREFVEAATRRLSELNAPGAIRGGPRRRVVLTLAPKEALARRIAASGP